MSAASMVLVSAFDDALMLRHSSFQKKKVLSLFWL
jgi:hypothetical protein